MNPFDLFETTNYTFLQLGSNVHGNVVLNEYTANGIVKLRDGMIQVDNMEERQSTSSVHIRPTEAFLSVLDGNLVGHGIRVQKDNHELADYRIDGQVEGYDFDTGILEFYKVTLKRESIATWDESELPLE
jgi:hypothetical protein